MAGLAATLIAAGCTLDLSGIGASRDGGATDAGDGVEAGLPDGGRPDGGMMDAGPPACDDTLQNGDETDVDCGGSCDPCEDGAGCGAGEDCESGVCGMGGTCLAPGCMDGVRNASETDVDCGGGCNPCADGLDCTAASDCVSLVCDSTSMTCSVPTCMDVIRNAAETDVDCGGGTCATCPDGLGCAMATDCMSGVCGMAGLCLPAGCMDGIRNGAETDLDCGGGCNPCGDGLGCAMASDCQSAVCDGTSMTCSVPTCMDVVANGMETDVDCGGPVCGDCADGLACALASDCQSGVCTANVCAAPTCMDVVANGMETDVDCGGPVCGGCADGLACALASDCQSGVCTANVCAAPTCMDVVANGMETDVDCGGPVCGDCADGLACALASDCQSGVCTANVCAAPTCMDVVANGMETDVDCGGPVCGGCADGLACALASDCQSGVCTANVCAAPTCIDVVANGMETDVDCGGPVCGDCADGLACALASDCQSGVCTANVCAAPTCIDVVANGMETDVDCGGPVCGDCADGLACALASDCQSGVCTANVCAAPTCMDVVANGMETDVDCGGPVCGGCADGLACALASDCQSGVCTANVCTAATCTDTVANGMETDVDCGGGACPTCPHGAGCGVNADCVTSACFMSMCVNGPTAGFSVFPNNGSPPLDVTATSTATAGDSAIVTTEYDWGEGGGFATLATHQYTTAGSFTVTQRVTDANGFIDTTTRPVSVSSFVPVRLSATDKGAGALLYRDGLEVENQGIGRSGARSNTALSSGSGVYYYEAERLISAVGVWGWGVATAAASLDDLPGQTSESAGMITEGFIFNPGGCTGSSNVGSGHTVAGFVVDYRGANPIMHLVLDPGTGPQILATCTMPVTTPVFIFYSGARFEVGIQSRFNTGSDTTNHPFAFSTAAVQAALVAAGEPTAASALVMGWGQTRARATSAAPVLSPPADMSVAVGTPVSLMATATDAEEGSLTAQIEWADLSTNHFAPTSATGATFSYTPTQIGRHPIRIRVSDSFDVRTEHIMVLNVTGTLPQPDPVELTVTPATGAGITVSADNLSVRYSLGDKRSILANQGCYGDYWYFEATRSGGPFSIGVGLAVDGGDLDPYNFTDPMWSMSINTLGDAWHNLISQGIFPDTATTYGFAVDYRGDNPIVHIITEGVYRRSITMSQTWIPVYPILYGGPTSSMAPAFDMSINFGVTPFVYDPVTVLGAATVDITGLEVGWGAANVP